ncbi:MFS transporter [Subtercola lobariae]
MTRTPAIRDSVGANTAEMGIVLFGLSVGSMAGVVGSGRLVRRVSTRPVIMVGIALVITGVLVIAVGSSAGAALIVFSGLVFVGIGSGLGEVALNIDAAALEKLLKRSVLPTLHGCYSLGTLVGAILGISLTAAQFPVVWHLVLSSIVMAGLGLWAILSIPGGTGASSPDFGSRFGLTTARRKRSVWLQPTVLVLGLVVLAVAFAEGSANDWLPLLMVDGFGLTGAQSSTIFAAFAAVMTIGRFAGQPLIQRLGKSRVLIGSVVLAAIGVVVVSVAATPALTVGGVVLWGLGASLGFPVGISAAGDSSDRPGQRVSAVTTVGYLAFLVGPPVLGFLGERYGLREAILLVAAVLACATLILVTNDTYVSVREKRKARVTR